MNEWDAERLDAEWLAVNAVHEVLAIARSGFRYPVYEDALAFAIRLLPSLFHPQKSVLVKSEDPDIVHEYRQKADAHSRIKKQRVKAIDIVKSEIKELEELLSTGNHFDKIRKKIIELNKVKDILEGNS